MSNSKLPKIVYLFGAGATHAEKTLECKIKNVGLKNGEPKAGLLAEEVSRRVINKLLKEEPETLSNYGITKSSLYYEYTLEKPDIDIELFISLVETVKTDESKEDAKKIRKYFREDIDKNLLIEKKLITPRLYSSLIEWHDLENCGEKLAGFLTLNYDSIFEKSFKLTETNFNYGLDVQIDKSLNMPHELGKRHLLKLHGSFDWYLDSDINKIIVSPERRPETMQWIPPGLNKEYLDYPYNIIHGKAYELLAECDILRAVGCSLNQNDIGLISLLLKTQKKRPNSYSIEIIGNPEVLKECIKRLGALLSFGESFYYKDEWKKLERDMTKNHFLDWLHYKVENTSNDRISDTKYLKNVKKWVDM